MVGCSSYGCKSRSEKKEPGITFHRFPMNDPGRLALWVKNMHIRDWYPTNNDKLCSRHFDRTLFYTIGKKTCLLDNAVPTVFEELPNYLQVVPRTKGARKRSSYEIGEPSCSTSLVQSMDKEITTPKEQNETPRKKRLRRQITSPMEQNETPRKKRLRRQLLKVENKLKQKSKTIKVLKQKVRRYKSTINSLKQIISHLKKKNLLSLEHSRVLDNLPDITKELLKRNMRKKTKYSPELRKFAITLSFFSPKGYDYVRQVFNTCLPHQSTIGKGFKNVNAEPGFSSESIELLRVHVQMSPEKNLLLALIIDEISIRTQVEWDGKKFHGYVDYGINLQDDENDKAKEAFVMMVNCINGQWKLPVGYFFTNGLSGEQKSSLVSQCIQLIHGTGASIVSLTFDGAPSNISMLQILGCKTDFSNLKPHFTLNEKTIYVFYDYCHMLKLVRNAFGERKIFKDGNGKFIGWSYLEKLEALQDSEGLHLGNKVRKAHLNFFKQKMKVKLAVQLLSNSVSDALAYCEEELDLPEFKGCQATCKFIKIFNNVFDILNCRSLLPPGFKKALCPNNIAQTTSFVNEAISYISTLKFADNGDLIIKSKRKTGFLGLITSLKSSLLLYDELITQKQSLIYLPIYKTSQDHLELFFSSIRSKGGWNNNPTSRQFTAAYKRLLVRTEIRDKGVGNCIPLEVIPILTGSSRFQNPDLNINRSVPGLTIFEDNEPGYNLQSIWGDHDYIMNSNIISNCSHQIVVYIAGFVAYQLLKCIKCEECLGALSSSRENFLHSLISKKNRGGLVYPCQDIVQICKICEHFLRVHTNNLNKNNFIKILKSKILFSCIENNYFNNLKDHVINSSSNHIYLLIESVISKYLNIRMHFIAKRQSEITDPVRNLLTKIILFKGQ